MGRATMYCLVTLNDERLDDEGCMDIVVLYVGLAQFIMVKTMTHEAILRWDQMARYTCVWTPMWR